MDAALTANLYRPPDYDTGKPPIDRLAKRPGHPTYNTGGADAVEHNSLTVNGVTATDASFDPLPPHEATHRQRVGATRISHKKP